MTDLADIVNTKIREDDRRDAFTDGLRQLANFLDTYPAVPCPHYATINIFVNGREEMSAVARAGTWEKVYAGNWFTLKKSFGEDLVLDVNAGRETVCRKVVVGTKIVPAVEAQPEHEEPVEEWVCDNDALLEPLMDKRDRSER